MSVNALPSETLSVRAWLTPVSRSANTYGTAWVKKSDFYAWRALLLAGTIASNGTVDFKLQEADNASGDNPQDVTGSAATQLTQAGTDSDKLAMINFQPDQHGSKSKPYFRATVITATAATVCAVLLEGVQPASAPARALNIAAVDEIVTPTRQ